MVEVVKDQDESGVGAQTQWTVVQRFTGSAPDQLLGSLRVSRRFPYRAI